MLRHWWVSFKGNRCYYLWKVDLFVSNSAALPFCGITVAIVSEKRNTEVFALMSHGVTKKVLFKQQKKFCLTIFSWWHWWGTIHQRLFPPVRACAFNLTVFTLCSLNLKFINNWWRGIRFSADRSWTEKVSLNSRLSLHIEFAIWHETATVMLYSCLLQPTLL